MSESSSEDEEAVNVRNTSLTDYCAECKENPEFIKESSMETSIMISEGSKEDQDIIDSDFADGWQSFSSIQTQNTQRLSFNWTIMEQNSIFKRPNPNDSENDLLKLQHAFLAEKSKNSSFQPAAKVVRLTNLPNPEPTATTRVSQFAKKRGIAREEPQNSKKNDAKLILGDIVENATQQKSRSFKQITETNDGFPKAIRINRSNLNNSDGSKSLFARTFTKCSTSPSSVSVSSSKCYGTTSSILKENDAKSIHDENVLLLNGFDEQEILAERQQLLNSMDPELIKFIQSKRKVISTDSAEPKVRNDQPKMDTDLSSLELLSHPNISSWPHFDVVETEKLEWMKDISTSLPQLKPGESYEARFDWKGVLLPYFSVETDSDRDLFLHGNDAQRPGYTLQELFRLARSNVMQQRHSAIGAIAGILNIHNQGFYDKILEIPISKVFFLLRFAFDDNTPFLLEATSKALATLFYNDSDEILLDCTRECSVHFREPTLGFGMVKKDKDDLNDQFMKMNLKETQAFQSVIDDEEDKSSLNDFHMAETDLIECLLRTNILQRIRYILFVVRPDNSTVVNCLKILIRLARTDKVLAEKIFHDGDLLRNCIREFLPTVISSSSTTQFYQRPQFLLLKLLRIIAAYELPVWTFDIETVVRSYLSMKNDLSIDMIKLQIESMRLVKTICLLRTTNDLYSDLVPAFQYLLEWHYNFANFNQQKGHSLIRQHAAALIALIGCKPFGCLIDAFPERLKLCISKWFYSATKNGIHEFFQIILLSTCLDTLSRMQGHDISDFLQQYLMQFLGSNCFLKICNDLCDSSLLLSSFTTKVNKNEALPDLDSVCFLNDSPTLIISEKYPICLLNSILTLLMSLEQRNNDKLFNDLMEKCVNNILLNYLQRLSCGFNENMKQNWFIRNELSFVVNLFRFRSIVKVINKTVLQKIAFNLMRCFTENELVDLLFIIKNVVFDVTMYDNAMDVFKTDMDTWRGCYLLLLGPIVQQTNSLIHTTKSVLLIPNDWFWLPLLIFLNADQSIEGNSLAKHNYIKNLKEKEIIEMTMRLTNLQKRNSLTFISPTEELMFLMISFMGPETSFLEPDICELLKNCVKKFFDTHTMTMFNFEEQFEGKSKFENLYVLFLDHFQGTSYGNETFSSLVMVPLAQKYDVKWRKMVWSEHAVVLRFISCSEDQCIGGKLDDYLYPIENDKSLLKCYYQAMNSILREGSLPYKIAKHHLERSQMLTKKL